MGHHYTSFRGFVRPAWLLREFRTEPEIASATVLFEDMPTGSGARLGAGAALARAMDGVRTGRRLYFPNRVCGCGLVHNSPGR